MPSNVSHHHFALTYIGVRLGASAFADATHKGEPISSFKVLTISCNLPIFSIFLEPLQPMFGEILQKFVAKSPATVMVRGLLERLLNPEALDRWFEATAQAQYTRDICSPRWSG